MAPTNAPRPASRRRRFVLVAAAVWIVVIVAGAGSNADDSLLGVDNLDVVWIIVFSIIVLLSIAFLIYLNPFGGEWVAPETRKRGIGAWVLAACVIALLSWQPDLLDGIANLGNVDGEEAFGESFETELESVPQEPAAETVAQATDILILVVAVGLIGGVWFLMRRTGGVHDDEGQIATALEVDLVQALDQAARELDRSTDPRTAVLRSYAVLETVLASHELTRAKSETPTEHLRRALKNLRIDAAPVVQLGELYEVARFS